MNGSDSEFARELRGALRLRDVAAARTVVEHSLGQPTETAVLSLLFRFRAYGDGTAHDVILALPKAWLREHAWTYIVPHLDGLNSQPFREFAITLSDAQLDAGLSQLLDLARKEDDYDIREVVKDFSPP